MEGVCSAQVQAQNVHGQEVKFPKNLPASCREPLLLLISTKADLYITGREEGLRRGAKVTNSNFFLSTFVKRL